MRATVSDFEPKRIDILPKRGACLVFVSFRSFGVSAFGARGEMRVGTPHYVVGGVGT